MGRDAHIPYAWGFGTRVGGVWLASVSISRNESKLPHIVEDKNPRRIHYWISEHYIYFILQFLVLAVRQIGHCDGIVRHETWRDYS